MQSFTAMRSISVTPTTPTTVCSTGPVRSLSPGGRGPTNTKIDIAHPDGVETKSVRQSEVLHLRRGPTGLPRGWAPSLFRDTLLRAVERGLLAGAVLPVQRVVSYPRSKGHGRGRFDGAGTP